MEGIRHRTMELNGGLNMHIAEKGKEGDPVVLFIHGFPDTWHSWRHQMLGIAQKGYHAVALDLRGFGETDVPEGVHNYTIMHVVGDLVALIDALGQEQVFVVGHDWGSVMAWGLALFRPEKVKALVNLSVPYKQRHPSFKPIAALKAIYGKNYYIVRYQEGGVAEAEFARVGYRTVLRNILTGPYPDPPILPEEHAFGGDPSKKEHSLPSWISEHDIDNYAAKFKNTGFTGGLNYYRCLDKNWELMAPWQGEKIKVPTKFIIGDEDLVYNFPGNKDYIHNGEFKKQVPLLQDVVIMEGVGHFINQERPHEITKHIYQFIKNF